MISPLPPPPSCLGPLALRLALGPWRADLLPCSSTSSAGSGALNGATLKQVILSLFNLSAFLRTAAALQLTYCKLERAPVTSRLATSAAWFGASGTQAYNGGMRRRVCLWPAAVPFFWHLLLAASAAELASMFFEDDLEPPQSAYQMWDSATNSAADPNTTIHIAGRSQVVAPGIQEWKNSSGSLLGSALFYVLPKLLSRKEVKRIRALVQDDPFDVDTDSVDGQWTHELYLESNGSFDNAARLVGKADALSPEVAAKRRALRRQVGAITQRIVRERVAPLVRARYPRLCGRSVARACTLCHSLVRRYLPDERRSHGLHFDLQSAVTVVVSLSEHRLVEVRWRHSSPYWSPLWNF